MRSVLFLTKITIFLLVSLIFVESGYSQGSFVNLDFEHPLPPLNPNDPFGVPIANALPGWIGYIGNNPVSRIVYNTVTLGAAAICSWHSGEGPSHDANTMLVVGDPFVKR